MIDLYTWSTPNGRKASIMLEEVGLPYKVHAIDIGAGDQFDPDFLKISPNNKIPAILDHDGPDGEPISIFESGAILIYLAEKTASPLLPTETIARLRVMEWLMFQMGNVGPMFGQTHHFLRFAKEDIPRIPSSVWSYGYKVERSGLSRRRRLFHSRCGNLPMGHAMGMA